MDFWCGENAIVHIFDGDDGMKKIACVLLGGWMSTAFSTPAIQVFVSFSLPEQLLQQTLSESARLHIPALLNGLYQNSMPETAKKIMVLAKQIPNLNLQIDPIAFERFGIRQVPALVVSNDSGFDVIYGNLSLTEGLNRIADNGTMASGLTHADVRRFLHE